MLAFQSLTVLSLCVWTKFSHPVKTHEFAEQLHGDNLIIKDVLILISGGFL